MVSFSLTVIFPSTIEVLAFTIPGVLKLPFLVLKEITAL